MPEILHDRAGRAGGIADNPGMADKGFTVERGFPEDQRGRVAALFWQAFSGKLGWVMAPEERALRFLAEHLDPSHAFSALSPGGEALGVAGFKTEKGSFAGGDFAGMRREYGLFGATWKSLVLAILEREVEPGVLLMDGIFVDAARRGAGIGSALLGAVVAEARERGLGSVRLDVIGSNPRARALYERTGFREVRTSTHAFLKPLFGFSASTEMRLRLDADEGGSEGK